jgi:hypothetical protein
MSTNRFANIIYRYKIMTAKDAAGDYSWTIGRPNYNQVDNTPTIIATNRLFFVEPTNDKVAIDKSRDGELYIVVGDVTSYQAGDLLYLPNSNDIPNVTIISNPFEQEQLAVKANKLGSIMDGGQPIYTNIYFDFLITSSAGGNNDPEITTSLNKPSRKVIMYLRPGIVEGMNFTDDQGNIWQISLVDYRFNTVILTLEEINRV